MSIPPGGVPHPSAEQAGPQQPHQQPYQQPYPQIHGQEYGQQYPPPPPAPGYGYAGTPLAWSDKSKTTAGLLELLLGFFLGIGGVGRIYAGHTANGVLHLVLWILGLITALIGIGFLLLGASWLWAVIDGIVILSGSTLDGQGRLLRP